MATPKKKYPYVFCYRDKTYATFELTKEDFTKVIEYKMAGREVVDLSIGFIEIKDVVTAVEQKVEEKPKKPTEDADKEEKQESFSKMFNLPYLDEESTEYLQKTLKNLWEGEH